MTIINRYVAWMFLTSYLILLLVGIGIYVLADVLLNFDEFIEDPTLSTPEVLAFMLNYYGYNLPLYFAQLGGPMLAVAAAFTLGALQRNNETVALLAAGMPLQRLATPILVCSVLLLAVWVGNKELLIPQVAQKIARQRDDISGTRTAGVAMVRDHHKALLTAQRLDPRRGRLERLQILVPDETGQYATLIDADEATYDPQRQTWVFGPRGWSVSLAGAAKFGQAQQRHPVTEFPYTLSPEELVLFQGSSWVELLSLRQMNALIASGGLPNRAMIITNRHIRLTQPMLYLTLVALVLPFFMTREPGSVLVAGGRAVVLCGAFLGIAFVAHGVVGEQGAALRAWVPMICFGPIAVMQLVNVKT